MYWIDRKPQKHFEQVDINSSKLEVYVKQLKKQKINQTLSVFHQKFLSALFKYIKATFTKSIFEHCLQLI